VAAVATVLSTWILGPTYHAASAGISQGLEYFRLNYALEIRRLEIGFDHSAFAIVKELTRHRGLDQAYFAPWLNGYMAVAALVGVVLYFWRIRKLPRANQILALTIASVLLPPVSSDYTLVHLYIPWAVLVLLSIHIDTHLKARGFVIAFVCLAFLMAPESYLILDGARFGGEIRFAGQLKAIALCVVFIVSMIYRLEETVQEDGENPAIA